MIATGVYADNSGNFLKPGRIGFVSALSASSIFFSSTQLPLQQLLTTSFCSHNSVSMADLLHKNQIEMPDLMQTLLNTSEVVKRKIPMRIMLFKRTRM